MCPLCDSDEIDKVIYLALPNARIRLAAVETAAMNKRVHSTDMHYIARADRARAAFVALRGEAAAARRQVEIDELPTVEFKGQTLYTIRCHGTTGKGPHDRHVPPAVLWSLIDLRAYVCPFHL